jgi:hypothetical protein
MKRPVLVHREPVLVALEPLPVVLGHVDSNDNAPVAVLRGGIHGDDRQDIQDIRKCFQRQVLLSLITVLVGCFPFPVP